MVSEKISRLKAWVKNRTMVLILKLVEIIITGDY
jgi:hypothetical protein